MYTDHLNLTHNLKIDHSIQYTLPHTPLIIEHQKTHKLKTETTHTRIPGLPACHASTYTDNKACAVCLSFCLPLSLSHTHRRTHTYTYIHKLYEGFFFTISKYYAWRMNKWSPITSIATCLHPFSLFWDMKFKLIDSRVLPNLYRE